LKTLYCYATLMRVAGRCSKQLSDFHALYGTAWKKNRTRDLVKEAFEIGFRGVDTACQPKHYQEKLVGDALREMFSEGSIKREDIWIQTKFTSVDGQDMNSIPYDRKASLKEQVQQSISISLENLGVETIDSLVLHSPMETYDETMLAWSVFEEAVKQGKVCYLGISNCYSFSMLRRLWEEVSIKPIVVQNRFYEKTGYDHRIREFCLEKGIVYQTFWTLTANDHAYRDKGFTEICNRRKLTGPQLLYKFVNDLGHQFLSGCCTHNHIREAFDVGNINYNLSDIEMERIKLALHLK